MKKIEQKVLQFIHFNDLINPNDNLLVAFSGGPDSTFAIYFFNKFKKKFKCNLSAVHFNHNLRGDESQEDEIFVKKFCEKFNINFHIVNLDVKSYAKANKLSIEEAARELRYFHLKKISDENNFNKIITAHNKNDNTETILQNLFAGTGVKGLVGIPIFRDKLIRPFLCLDKIEIIEYLNQNKIDYRIDLSNFSNEFKRNYLRNKILPLIRKDINPSVDDAFLRFSNNLNEQIYFENKTNDYLIKKFTKRIKNGFELSLSILKIYDKIPGTFLKKFFEEKLNSTFSHNDYIKVNELIKKQKGKSIQLKKNVTALREDDSINFLTNEENHFKEINIKLGEEKKFDDKRIKIIESNLSDNFSKEKKYELISADKLSNNFTLRYWKDGDKFKPLGMNKLKKISDFLTDLKIPSNQKRKIPVLINRNQIIYVVGLRISNDVKITNKTKRVIKICLK